MAGRAKKECYEYTNKGKFIRVWDCIAAAKKHHYPDDIGSRPLFTKPVCGFSFHITPSDTVIMLERVYRNNIKRFYKIYKSPLCNFNFSKNVDKPIQMFNLRGELLAEFASSAVAKTILSDKFPPGTIYSQVIQRGTKNSADNVHSDYYFQYK